MRNPGLREVCQTDRVPDSLPGATEPRMDVMKIFALSLIGIAATLAALALMDNRYDGRMVLAVVFLVVAAIVGGVVAHREEEIL